MVDECKVPATRHALIEVHTLSLCQHSTTNVSVAAAVTGSVLGEAALEIDTRINSSDITEKAPLAIFCSSNHLPKLTANASVSMSAVLASAQHRIVLVASNADASIAGLYTWRGTCANIPEAVFVVRNGSSTLTIAESTFPSGTECLVTLKVSNGPCLWEGAISLTMVSPPWGGDLDVVPSNVRGVHNVRAEGWNDLQIMKPLAYSVLVLQLDGTLLPLTFESFKRDALVMLPPKCYNRNQCNPRAPCPECTGCCCFLEKDGGRRCCGSIWYQ